MNGIGCAFLAALLAGPAPPWRAKWIFCEGEPSPANFYLHLRRTVRLPAAPRQARVRISADSRYRLWVNGRLASRGPARCDPRHQAYDEVDLAPHLRAGGNVLAALLHHYGAWTFAYIRGRGGFLLDGEAICEDGSRVRLDTDRRWKALPARAWARDVPRIAIQLGFPEIFDARLEPAGWRDPGFDDAPWPPAAEIGTPPVDPWPAMVPRGIPGPDEVIRSEKLLAPSAVLEAGEVGPPPGRTFIDLAKLMDPPRCGVAYCLTSIWSPRPQEGVEILAGGADGFKLWWNGGLVAAHEGVRPADPEDVRAKVTLRSGWNQVLAKIAQERSPWTFSFRLEGEGVGRLPYSPWKDMRARPGPLRWVVIGPFENPEAERGGGRKGFDAVYPPEREQDPDYRYRRRDGRELRWRRVESMPEPLRGPADQLAFEGHLPLRGWRIAHRLALTRATAAGSGATIRPSSPLAPDAAPDPRRGIHVVLDYGREVFGFAGLALRGTRGGEIVDIGYAEALTAPGGEPVPAASPGIGRVKPNRGGLPYADRLICRPGENRFETFEKRAFRYQAIAVRGLRGPIELGPVWLRLSTYPVREAGLFACSDPLLNRIWRVGRWTVRLNMDDAYTDGPWRGRAQWWGDARIEARVAAYAFGDTALLRRALLLQADSQDAEGLVLGVWPTGWDGGRLPDHALWWVLSIEDYAMLSGDVAIARDLWPRVRRVLAFFRRRKGEGGVGTALDCLYAGALGAAARIARRAGEDGDAEACAREADAVRRALLARARDARGIFHDRVHDGERDPSVSVHSNSLAILFDIAPREDWERILDWIHDPDHEVVPAGTPSSAFDVLQALWKEGDGEGALSYIRSRWGPMLQWGATTWWEHWEPKGGLCRGASAGPTHDLSAYVLGARPAAPGWSRVRIAPQPGDLRFAQGVVPTPRGPIPIAWRRRGEGFVLDLTLPRRIEEAEIVLDPDYVWRIPRGEAEAVRPGTFRAPGGQILRFEGE